MSNDIAKPYSDAPSEIEIAKTYKRIFSYLMPYRFYLFVAFVGYGLFALSQPAFAYLMEYFVKALDGTFVNGLYLIPLACIVIALMRGVGSYLGSYYMSKASQNMIHDIRTDLFDNVLHLPIGYFDQNKTGRVVSLFTYNTSVMTLTTAKAFTILVREGLSVIALFTYLFYQNFQLTLIFLVLGPPIALLISWIGKKIKRLGHDIQAIVGELNHVITEVFGGIRMVKSVVAEKSEGQRFNDISHKTKKLGLHMAKISSIYTPLMQMMIVFAMAMVMYVVLLNRDSMDPAALIAYVTAAALLPKPIRSLSSVHPQILQGVVAAGEVFKHIDDEKEIDTGAYNTSSVSGKLEFDNVRFTYGDIELEVLKGVSFVVEPGQTLAIVGRSGGGKSTLVNLIPRFYTVNDGLIKIDGRPIDEYTLDHLRNNIAIVSQHVVLFNNTIAENIAFGVDGVDIDEIKSAAKVANAHDFIMALPNAYNTLVGENGVLLSGGQRQRLAIARALLRDAPILILDEATSALDNESEAKVQAALESVMANRTTIIIAHRLSTVEHADKIIVLDKGEVIEEGTHVELMCAEKAYAQMVHRDFTG